MVSKVFLTIFLPTLSFDRIPEMSSEDVSFYFQQNLSKHELNILKDLYTFYDAENARLFLSHQNMMYEGSYHHEELKEKIEEGKDLPYGLDLFFNRYKQSDERKSHAHELMHFFLTHIQDDLHPFIKKYFAFENTYRHVMAYLRAHESHQKYTPPFDEVGFDLVNIKTWNELFIPFSSIFQKYSSSPFELDEAICHYKFEAIERLTSDSPDFSIDYILAYMVRLRMIEMRHELKKAYNPNILERLVKAVE
jgi:hypothetical protein